MTETAVRSPVEILTLCRTIFAATHWTAGTFAGNRYVYTDNGEPGTTKKVACSVGGLRYAALAPMDHALDETWMVAHLPNLAGHSFDEAIPDSIMGAYLEAIEALYAEARHDGYVAYQQEVEGGGYETTLRRIEVVENGIVDWNDSFEYGEDDDDFHDDDAAARRTEIVQGKILPAFDRAIARLGGNNSTGEGGN